MASGGSGDDHKTALARAALDRHGHTYAHEIGIRLEDNPPSALFQWLCAAIMFSAPIGAAQTVRGARALFDAGLTTARKIADASWDDRRRPLTEHGHMLGEVATLVEEAWKGDLRRLREECRGDPDALRAGLKRAKGLGDVGVDIFFREVQGPWEDLRPFADRRALGLGNDAAALAGLVPAADFPRFVAGLVRTDLAGDAEDIKATAG